MKEVFRGAMPKRPPFWFMRQAGRYLAEYKQVRASLPDFLSLCYTPEKAAEVTMQPIHRFGMDAAIIFSDILVVLHAMGVPVRFVEGEGPQLERVEMLSSPDPQKLEPVYEAVRLVRSRLPGEKSLIGFAGAPWTLFCYLMQGKGDGNFAKALEALYLRPEFSIALLGRLGEAVAAHLIAQVEAGADVLQIFDSWAGTVPAPYVETALIQPVREIVARVRKAYPDVPLIAFPRGMRGGHGDYAVRTGVSGISVETALSLSSPELRIEGNILQGNLDPVLLAVSKEGTLKRAREILESMRGKRFIFNLGHGVLPHTPVAHVEALSELLREWR